MENNASHSSQKKSGVWTTEYEIVKCFGHACEYRDIETSAHISRMSHYSKQLAFLCGLPDEEQELLFHASTLHDVGKVGIPEAILLKPGKLNEEEFEMIKQHTLIGATILSGTHPILIAGKMIALEHHEKWDGTGYPNRLKGEEISLYGRITAIADVFDALISKRVYKKAYTVEEAVNILIQEKEKAFDPTLIDLFLDNLDDFVEIKERYLDTALSTPHIIELVEDFR